MKNNAVQSWLPYEEILENGIIKLKDKSYIKILKVSPINFNLKSELEKEAILNSYKNFLKTCNFNFQILIQSNKEDLATHIKDITQNIKDENKNISNIAENYIKYISSLNHNKKSSSKNFFIIIKHKSENKKNQELDLIIEELNDRYFKIKDNLARCGNIVSSFNNKEQIIRILFSFLNTRIHFSKM